MVSDLVKFWVEVLVTLLLLIGLVYEASSWYDKTSTLLQPCVKCSIGNEGVRACVFPPKPLTKIEKELEEKKLLKEFKDVYSSSSTFAPNLEAKAVTKLVK